MKKFKVKDISAFSFLHGLEPGKKFETAQHESEIGIKFPACRLNDTAARHF